MTDLADLSLVEAADAVRNGDATSIELLDACWRNMDAANPQAERDDLAGSRGRRSRRHARRIAAVREQGLARPAARRADGAQGHVLPGGQALHLRLGDPQGLAPGHHRDRDRAAVARPAPTRSAGSTWRSSRRTRPATTRIRRLPQSVEPALHHRRLLLRLRRCRSRRASTTRRWAPTPAARSGCRPRPAASPASSRRRPACRATG